MGQALGVSDTHVVPPPWMYPNVGADQGMPSLMHSSTWHPLALTGSLVYHHLTDPRPGQAPSFPGKKSDLCPMRIISVFYYLVAAGSVLMTTSRAGLTAHCTGVPGSCHCHRDLMSAPPGGRAHVRAAPPDVTDTP